jgi:hypothetical protein
MASPRRGPTRPPHVTYVVERYWPGVTDEALRTSIDAACKAASHVASEGRSLRFVDAFVIAEDRVALTVFEADSRATVQEATRRAGLPYDRITRLDRPSALPPQQE